MEEKTKSEQKKFCTKLAYGDKKDPTVILGIVISEDINFLIFRTANKEYRISQALVLSMESTDQEFNSNLGGKND